MLAGSEYLTVSNMMCIPDNVIAEANRKRARSKISSIATISTNKEVGAAKKAAPEARQQANIEKQYRKEAPRKSRRKP